MKPISSIHFISIYISVSLLLTFCQAETNKPSNKNVIIKSYYISKAGNDDNDGTREHPWATLSRIKELGLHAGDSVLLEGGQTFTGSLMVYYKATTIPVKPIVVASFGNGKAVISSGNEAGLIINNSSYLQIQNIKLSGAGRKEGNATNGISIAYCDNIKIDSLEITGYQKSGLLLRNCTNISVQNVYAHDNGYAGISVSGDNLLKTDCRNIAISYCRAENNPGDPTNKSNHSGNGIIVSQCTNVKIAYCTATNNGWDMPRIGNGPVGIWAWDVDSAAIEYCLSYRNKTSTGGGDGGGFDLDGGVTNSVIQYCLSYENDGSGIGLFEYNKAGTWQNNTIRYNISINDGNISAAKSGIFIWNSSTTEALKDCFIYNNTVYNNKNAAINFSEESNNEGFIFCNNILVGNKQIISGKNITGKYLGNCWWSLTDGFNMKNIHDFNDWAAQQQQEMINGNIVGENINPAFIMAAGITITDAKMLSTFHTVKANLPALLNGGIDMQQLFGILKGGKDFNGNPAPLKGVGASF
jgi:hypothetical protein